MYCPNCGSNNEDDQKFCTRCGTNLDVVSDALCGRIPGPVATDERMVNLLKDYYRSRRMTVIGSVASLIGLFKLAVLLVMGFPEKLVPLSVLLAGLLLFGFFALIWGMIKWNNSSSEIKALGYTPTRAGGLRAVPSQLRLQADPSKTVAPVNTDPLAAPVSITEHTTHFLDEQNQPQPNQRPLKERH